MISIPRNKLDQTNGTPDNFVYPNGEREEDYSCYKKAEPAKGSKIKKYRKPKGKGKRRKDWE